MFVLAFSSDADVVSEKSSHWNERHVLKDKWYLQLNDDENTIQICLSGGKCWDNKSWLKDDIYVVSQLSYSLNYSWQQLL